MTQSTRPSYRGPTDALRRDENGQVAIAMVLILIVVFTLFALGLDVGFWAFDHRTAQNQADAAAHAAVQLLPDTTAATAAADTWLVKNGSGPGQRSCLEYSDLSGDGNFDTVRVCVRRQSPGFFSPMAGIPFAWVSAAATASTGRANRSNVMPWGIVPPDPTCDNPGEICQDDLDGDGVFTDCGYYPPVPEGGVLCPWGLNADRLYAFKLSGTITPGNFGAVAVCGQGAVNYRNCINGQSVSGVYEEGETVNVEPQTGNLGGNTDSALAERYSDEGADGTYECDVAATPDAVTGLDPDGRATAASIFTGGGYCAQRMVVILIVDHFPTGGSDPITILGVATFGIAKWDRRSPYGDALGTTTAACGAAGDPGFECGMVWGYLMEDVLPPDFLLAQMSDSDNPFAPVLFSLIE